MFCCSQTRQSITVGLFGGQDDVGRGRGPSVWPCRLLCERASLPAYLPYSTEQQQQYSKRRLSFCARAHAARWAHTRSAAVLFPFSPWGRAAHVLSVPCPRFKKKRHAMRQPTYTRTLEEQARSSLPADLTTYSTLEYCIFEHHFGQNDAQRMNLASCAAQRSISSSCGE